MSNKNLDLRLRDHRRRTIHQIPQTFRNAVRRVQTELMRKVWKSSSTIDNRPAQPLPESKETRKGNHLPSKEELEKVCAVNDYSDQPWSDESEYDYPDLSKLGELPPPSSVPPKIPDTARPTYKKVYSQSNFLNLKNYHDNQECLSEPTYLDMKCKETQKSSKLDRQNSYVAERIKQLNKYEEFADYVSPVCIGVPTRTGTYRRKYGGIGSFDTKFDYQQQQQQYRIKAYPSTYQRVSLYDKKPSTAPKPTYIETSWGQDRPTLKVRPNCRQQESIQYDSKCRLSFSEMSVEEVYMCLKECGLHSLANLCQEEELDGQFINNLSKEELQKELHLSSLHTKKLEMIKTGWRPLKH